MELEESKYVKAYKIEIYAHFEKDEADKMVCIKEAVRC